MNKKYTSEIDVNGRTVIQFLLPFALHGAEGLYLNQAGEVEISLIKQPEEFIFQTLHLNIEPKKAKQNLMLDPDNLGVIHKTIIAVRTKGYLAIEAPEDQNSESYEKIMLEKCDIAVSEIFSWYIYCSRNFKLPKISLRNCLTYEAWHEKPNDKTRYNYLMKTLRTTKLKFTQEISGSGNQKLRESMMALQKLPSMYQLAINLFTEAMQALLINNTRLACIQASTSIEIALSYYLNTRVKAFIDGNGEKRLSFEKYQAQLGKAVTLSSMINLFFPLLLPANIKYPKEIIDSCNRIRIKRNDAVHKGVEVEISDIEKDISRVEDLIKFLIKLKE